MVLVEQRAHGESGAPPGPYRREDLAADVLVGEKDPMGPGGSVLIRRSLPGATLEVVPGEGHWLHVSAPDLVVAAIERFLQAYFPARAIE